jgi:hypothetical protein
MPAAGRALPNMVLKHERPANRREPLSRDLDGLPSGVFAGHAAHQIEEITARLVSLL